MVGGYLGLGNAADCRTQPILRTAKIGFSRQIQESIDTLLTNDNNSHCDLVSPRSSGPRMDLKVSGKFSERLYDV
jgi:hypothetical protein